MTAFMDSLLCCSYNGHFLLEIAKVCRYKEREELILIAGILHIKTTMLSKDRVVKGSRICGHVGLHLSTSTCHPRKGGAAKQLIVCNGMNL